MSYAFIATGAVTSAFNLTITPAMPAGFVAGNLLLLHTGSYQGSLATPAVAGWTLLSPGVNANQVALFGKIAVGSDASPSITWGNQFSHAWVQAYSGNPATLAGIVHASVDQKSTNLSQVGYGALTVTQPNCLIISGGARDKTATTNAATWGALSGSTIRQSTVQAGTNIAAVVNDQIQTTATNLLAGNQALSVLEGAATQYESYRVALNPLIVVAPSNQVRRNRRVVSTTFYPMYR